MTSALNCKGVSATITRWPKNVLQPQKKFKPFDPGSTMSLNMKMVRICLYGTFSIVLISQFNHISSACMESLDISRLMNDDSYVARFFLHCTDIPGESHFLNIITSSFCIKEICNCNPKRKSWHSKFFQVKKRVKWLRTSSDFKLRIVHNWNAMFLKSIRWVEIIIFLLNYWAQFLIQ